MPGFRLRRCNAFCAGDMCKIVELAGSGGRILELGCGAGWLCIELAKSGANEVCGVDFAAAQIAIANRRAQAAGLVERVQFKCMDGTQSDESGERFDCVVVHGFLHHLNRTEIRRTMASVPRLLKANGSFIVFEPVLSDFNSECRNVEMVDHADEIGKTRHSRPTFRFPPHLAGRGELEGHVCASQLGRAAPRSFAEGDALCAGRAGRVSVAPFSDRAEVCVYGPFSSHGSRMAAAGALASFFHTNSLAGSRPAGCFDGQRSRVESKPASGPVVVHDVRLPAARCRMMNAGFL